MGIRATRFLIGFVLSVLALNAVALHFFDGFRLDVGSVMLVTHRYAIFSALLLSLGSIAAAMAALGLERWFAEGGGRKALSDARSVFERNGTLLVGLLGVLVPLAYQSAILQRAPVTDDEASYRFSAELFAMNKLFVESPPWKLFFDNAFLVNNGRLYSQYFPGWPFLLSVGVRLGVPWVINPLLSGWAALLIFWTARRLWSLGWAAIAAGLYIFSPFAGLSAATGMSHTATVAFLAAAVWCLISLDNNECQPRWAPWSAGLALALSLAFLTRPGPALGAGVPLVAFWFARSLKTPRHERTKAWVAFALAAGPLALLFLLYNASTHGSPFTTGYHQVLAASQLNGFRFAAIGPPSDAARDRFLFFLGDETSVSLVANAVVALLRLNTDAFGWPASLLFALWARGTHARAMWLMFGGLMVAAAPAPDGGVDSFGPVHYTELLVPLVFLSVDGLRELQRQADRMGRPGMVAALLVGCFGVTALCWAPSRLATLRRIAADVNRPREFVEEMVPRPAVVFAPRPFAMPCASAPARNFVFFRPNPRPSFDDPILYVNHISVERDRALLDHFPGRKGFILQAHRRTCELRLVPLEEATPEVAPPAVKELAGDFPDWPLPSASNAP